jgi:hypothetical protein
MNLCFKHSQNTSCDNFEVERRGEPRPHAFGLWIDCFEPQRWLSLPGSRARRFAERFASPSSKEAGPKSLRWVCAKDPSTNFYKIPKRSLRYD